MYLFCQMIYGDITRRTDEHLRSLAATPSAATRSGEVVDNGGGRDCLAGPWWALDKRKGFLKDTFDSFHLRVIEFW